MVEIAKIHSPRGEIIRCLDLLSNLSSYTKALKISNLIDQSLSTVDSRSETEGWIYELLLFLYRVTL